MAMVAPFVVPVNGAGLPLAFCAQAADGSENLADLTAEEVSRLYWLLEGLQVDYTFTVNGARFQRGFFAPALPAAGVERVCARPVALFENGAGEDPLEIVIEARLDHGHPRVSDAEAGLFGLELRLAETDLGGSVVFALAPQPGYTLAGQREFAFMERNLTGYLSVLDPGWSGSVDALAVEPVFAGANPQGV